MVVNVMTKTVSESFSKKNSVSKTTFKQHLLQPYILTWPQLNKGIIPDIISSLTELFTPSIETTNCKIENKPSDRLKIFKKHLVFGTREVTRGLERNTLSSVIVCRSINHPILIRYLTSFAASNQIPLVAIPNLSSHLKTGLKSLQAIGVLKTATDEKIKEFDKNINSKVQAPTLPWSLNSSTNIYKPARVCINKAVTKAQNSK